MERVLVIRADALESCVIEVETRLVVKVVEWDCFLALYFVEVKHMWIVGPICVCGAVQDEPI